MRAHHTGNDNGDEQRRDHCRDAVEHNHSHGGGAGAAPAAGLELGIVGQVLEVVHCRGGHDARRHDAAAEFAGKVVDGAGLFGVGGCVDEVVRW